MSGLFNGELETLRAQRAFYRQILSPVQLAQFDLELAQLEYKTYYFNGIFDLMDQAYTSAIDFNDTLGDAVVSGAENVASQNDPLKQLRSAAEGLAPDFGGVGGAFG